jgi:hypothetical protein
LSPAPSSNCKLGFPNADKLAQRVPSLARDHFQIAPFTDSGRNHTPQVIVCFDEHLIVRRSAYDMAFAAGQKILDPIPLVVAQPIASHSSAPPQADRP